MTRRIGILLLLAAAGLFLFGCQSAYYATMEKFGVHKRDILVDRVEEARDSQQEAKQQFKSALEQFSAVVKVQGGELEETYQKLDAELERSEKRADEVHERIAAVEEVAEALFDEWKAELRQYSSDQLRRASQKKLDQTRRDYANLLKAMKRAEAKIEPVLAPMRDQVLFLKHNLNARAISSIKGELRTIEADVSALIRDMEASIREADAFIKGFTAG